MFCHTNAIQSGRTHNQFQYSLCLPSPPPQAPQRLCRPYLCHYISPNSFSEYSLNPIYLGSKFNVHGSVHCNNILIYIQQDATLYSLFYLETALHVLGGTSTHHQERKQLYLQHLVFVTPLLLSAAIVGTCCGWRTPPTAHSNRFQLFHDSGK
jgi:hypothetical protein